MKRTRISIGRKARKIGFLGTGMRVPTDERSEITHALALRIDESLIAARDIDRERRRHDLEPVPGILGRVFSREPDAVVFPDSAQCVADVLDICIEEETCAVPRGAASAGLGGATAVRGGVVVDMTKMSRVLSVDRSGKTVTVEAGCLWPVLEEELAKENLCLVSYPSSAPWSTIGGWMSTGGYGIGTHREGCFHRQVQAMEVALPSGLLVNASHGEGRYAIGSFAGTEGQMGIITRLTLPVKDAPERRAFYVLRFGEETGGFEVLHRLATLEDAPFSAGLVNGNRSRLLSDISGLPTDGRPYIMIADEGDASRVADLDRTIRELARLAGIEVDDGPDASRLWKGRFTYRDILDQRPVRLAGEVVVETGRLGDLLASIGGSIRGQGALLCDCQVIDSGKALVTVSCLAGDDTEVKPKRDVATTGRVAALGVRHGGVPYGIGLWNSAYSKLILGRGYKRLKEIKDEIDRLGILNPGKFFSLKTGLGFPVPGWLYRAGVGLIRK